MTEVWPVIHISDNYRTTVENAKIAQGNGAAGVMLISMEGHDFHCDEQAVFLRARCPGLKIGVNYLGMPDTARAIHRSLKLGYDATWWDRHEFDEEKVPEFLSGANEHPDHKFFAAVGFKGQPEDKTYWLSAGTAAKYGFIPTTSGFATGEAPTTWKVTVIRDHLLQSAGKKFNEKVDALAIASGMTPETVWAYAPYVTHILVSTGISKDFYQFDADKVKRFMQAVAG